MMPLATTVVKGQRKRQVLGTDHTLKEKGGGICHYASPIRVCGLGVSEEGSTRPSGSLFISSSLLGEWELGQDREMGFTSTLPVKGQVQGSLVYICSFLPSLISLSISPISHLYGYITSSRK